MIILNNFQDKVGVSQKERSSIKAALFGPDGVSSADDQIVFDYRLERAEKLWTETCEASGDPKHVQYFEDRLARMLKTNFDTKTQIPWVADLGDWTNNNCESMNHVLKNSVDWQTQPITTLVHNLKKVMCT